MAEDDLIEAFMNDSSGLVVPNLTHLSGASEVPLNQTLDGQECLLINNRIK